MVAAELEKIPLSRIVHAFSFLGIVAVLGIVIWKRGESLSFFSQLFSMEQLLMNLAIGVGVGLIAIVLILLLIKATSLRLPMNDYMKHLKEIMMRPYGALVIGVLPGIFEELLFRGFLLALGIELIGTFWAVIVTSVIFCALHFPQYRNIWLINMYVLLLAVVLSYLFILTGSLWAPMAAHAVYNYGVTVLTQQGIISFAEN